VSFRRRLALCCAVAVVLGCALAYVIVRDTLRARIDDSLRDRVAIMRERPLATRSSRNGCPPVFTRLVGRTPLPGDDELVAVANGKREPPRAPRSRRCSSGSARSRCSSAASGSRT
jgi:hypothetical protein